jgi:hypothetical protein
VDVAVIDGSEFSSHERWLVGNPSVAYRVVTEAVDAFGEPSRNIPTAAGYAYVEFNLKPKGQLTIAVEPTNEDFLASTSVTIIFSDDVDWLECFTWLCLIYAELGEVDAVLTRSEVRSV